MRLVIVHQIPKWRARHVTVSPASISPLVRPRDRPFAGVRHRSLVEADVAREVEDPLDRRIDDGLEAEPRHVAHRRSVSPNPPGVGQPARIDAVENGVAGARSAGGGSANGRRLDDALGEDVDLRDRDERDPHRRVRRRARSTRCAAIGRRTKTGRRPVDAGDAPDGVAERHRVGPEDRDRAVRQPLVAERGGLEEPRDVVDGDRADGAVAQAHEPEDRERVEGAAQVVEHVVAAPVDHAGLEDRVGQAGGRGRAPRRPTSSGGRSSGHRVGRAGS